MECRGLVRDRFFGAFDHKIYLHRYSDQKKFDACLNDVGNNLEGAFDCVKKYHNQIKETNEQVTKWFKETHSNYV